MTPRPDQVKVAEALELYDNRAFVIRELSPELDVLWHAAKAWLDDQWYPEALVTEAIDGPRFDAIHPLNAPLGAYVGLTLMHDAAPEVLTRWRLVPVPVESEETE